MIPYKLEHIGSSVAKLGPIEILGPGPDGFRINLFIASGEGLAPDGTRTSTNRPGGADYLTIRPDGVGILDVRTTVETADGALLFVSYSGMMDLGPDGYQKLVAGEPLPNGVPVRATPRMFTSHPSYLALNRLMCLGIGVADLGLGVVKYDLYAVL